ncbi:MAG: tripartite tricarboxylate transporter TctB family protein [Acidocella sp.]|nr:tripartite tricarboxylate transporter TctB family protein [Acidocella sp.]
MTSNQSNLKDILGGGLMLVIGLGTCWQAAQYELGSLQQMGPGFFPMSLGVILAVTGLLILISGLRTAPEMPRMKWQPQWRGWLCICTSLVAFVVIGNFFGLLPATFSTVLIAAFGDRKNSLAAAIILAACMTLVCLIVFWWLLQVQFPLFKWG